MTYKEALSIIRTHKTYMCEMDADKLIEALEKAEDAIEKQIPKTIVYEDIGHLMPSCPNCGGDYDCVMYDSMDENDFCTRCGQALDWSENQ